VKSTGGTICVGAIVQWPEFGINAGGAVHAFEVARVLTRTHDVVVVIPDFLEGDVRAAFPTLALRIVRLPAFARRSTIGFQIASLFGWLTVRDVYRRSSVIVATSHFLGDVLPLLYARRPGIVVVHHLAASPLRRSGSFLTNAAHYVTERASLWFASFGVRGFVTSSETVKRQISTLRGNRPIVVTTNAPRSAGRHNRATSPKTLAAVPMLTYVGRLSPTKGLDLLIDAWSTVVKAIPSARLQIAGDGSPLYRSELERRAARLGVSESIVFHGRIGENEKTRLLESSTLFAFPSREEGFGIVLAEAMSYALPCVTLDLPIFRELFPLGRLIAADAPEAYGRTVLDLLSDAAKYNIVSMEALTMASSFTWERAATLDVSMLQSNLA